MCRLAIVLICVGGLFGPFISAVRAEITAEQVREAIQRGVGYLKNQQRADGSWPDVLGMPPGGVDALCTLALLNAGVEPDEEPIERALNNLRKIKPVRTYVVALQTMVFARASPQRDKLLIARNVLNPREVKYFVGDAPPKTPVGTLLRVGFSRWPIERAFEDQKSGLGLDHYEGRRYPGLKRHLILSAISHLFLARVHLAQGGKRRRTDRPPDPYGDPGPGPLLVAVTPRSCQAHQTVGKEPPSHPGRECQSPQSSHQEHAAETTGFGP